MGAFTFNPDVTVSEWSIHSSQMNGQWRIGALNVMYRPHGYQSCLLGCQHVYKGKPDVQAPHGGLEAHA